MVVCAGQMYSRRIAAGSKIRVQMLAAFYIERKIAGSL
jgi:hypothetical protein